MENKQKPAIRFKGFTEDWEQRKLGEITSKYEDPVPTPHDGYYRLGIRSHAKGTFHSYVAKGQELETAQMHRVAAGNFIVNITFGWEHAVAITDENDAGKLVSHRFPQFSFAEGMVPEFFRYVIVDEKFRHHLWLASPGGAGRNRVLKLDEMLNYLMRFPSRDEQVKIAEFFRQLDHLITLHQRKYDKLVNVKKSMLEKMFPRDGQKVPEIRFAGYTDDWEQRKAVDLAEYSKGNGYSKGDLTDEGTPIILYGRLYTKYQLAINDVDTFVVPRNGAIYSKGNEVIVPASGETAEDIARASVVEKSGVLLGGDLNILRPFGFINPLFLALTISNGESQNELAKKAQGKSVVHIHNSDIQEVTIAYPSRTEQERIVSVFRQLDHLITLHQCKYLWLSRIRQAIFQAIDKTTWEQRKVDSLFEPLTERNDDLLPYSKTLSVATMTYKEVGNGAADSSLANYKRLRLGDIAFEGHTSKEFRYGRFVLNDAGDGIMSPRFSALRPVSELPVQFWKYYIHYEPIMKRLLVNCTKAGTMMNELVVPEFLRESLLVPSTDEQVQIGQFFTTIDHLITLHQRKLKSLNQLKQAMLTSFFTNETAKKSQKERKTMTFKYESDFEEALIKVLSDKGWEKEVIKYPTEKDLLDNWARILFDNNRGIDRLNNYPLTEGEMQQILEQINTLRTPIKLNKFINGTSVAIKRDNPDDKEHFGKEISLKIYDRREIAAGQSRYQIVQQPIFPRKSKILNDRRGDLMLLINGMPVIHIELKRSGAQVSQAYNQIEKYAKEGVFTGLFSLVQVFVAMTPSETRYFANPGMEGKFNPNYYFQWADFNNEPIHDWKDIASSLLSIPMAHQLIGFYTVADEADGVLKVMRSYQYYAASAISDKVSKTKWDEGNQRGGFIWHTTGSGKTMTSFKSAQLIADSQDADKVVFLMDRIELGTQSLGEYRGFAGESKGISNDQSSVKATENTHTLISKLKSPDPLNTLIVTSIQKMSRIKDEDGGLHAYDIEEINKKRIVFIVDECHRSTFGDMLLTIKNTFPNAIFFGFTGTPIQDENQKKMNTTMSVFGDELHRYIIADGIRDENVLGFDPYKVMTFKDSDLRREVALEKAKAETEEEAISDPKKAKIYYKYMDSAQVKMAGYLAADGKYQKGIEDYISNAQYRTPEHQEKVVEDIAEKWMTLSHASKFHAIFATSSIPEAIEYYRLLKDKMPDLKTTCLFDPNIDNDGGVQFKEEGIVEIIDDYNKLYGRDFSLGSYAAFKKDIALRLAHKEYYKRIEREPEQQLDLLIVVDQMLTGFDSKWVNTLYLDKLLEYENIIQAFSRTNRLFGPEKKFGTIRYYRKPHTMEQNIKAAVRLYSGDKPIGLFVDKLYQNLRKMNELFADIKELFQNAGISDFVRLPEDRTVVAKFAALFGKLNDYLEAARIQGFKWNCLSYSFVNEDEEKYEVTMDFDETTYLILVQRYKEIPHTEYSAGDEDIPYDLLGYITEIDTGRIDADYMNSRFEKYLKLLYGDGESQERTEQALNELHKSFATLSQEEQKYANIFLHDVQRGDVFVDGEKSLNDYIIEYACRAKNDQIHRFAEIFGLYEEKLRSIMGLKLTEANINEFNRLDELEETIDKGKAREYFEKKEGVKLNPSKVNIRTDKLVREFILQGGFELD